MTNSKYMTPIEVSKELGVCRLTVYTLIRKRILAAHVVGNQYRVSREQLDKYLTETDTRRG